MGDQTPGLTVGVVVVLMVNVFINKDDVTVSDIEEARTDRIASVLQDAGDEFGLFSFEIGDTDPTIWIGMDETKNEQELWDEGKNIVKNGQYLMISARNPLPQG